MKYCLTIACALTLALFIAGCRNDSGEPAPADTQVSPAPAPEVTPGPAPVSEEQPAAEDAIPTPGPEPETTPGPEAEAEPVYDFRKARWGMSLEEVKASEVKQPSRQASNALDYDDKVAGFFAYINYMFENDKLIRAGFIFPEKRKENQQYIEDYMTLKDTLTQAHGEPVIDEIKVLTGEPIESSKLADAVCAGKAIYGAEWSLPRTTIRLVLHSIQSFCDLVIIYTPNASVTPEQNGHGL